MSERLEGTGAAAVGAHSKDAMQDPQHRTPPQQSQSESTPGEADGVGASTRSAADATRAAADQAGREASRLATSAQEGVSRAGRQAYRQGAQAGAYVSESVRSDPLIALAVVGALGFVLGLLAGRR